MARSSNLISGANREGYHLRNVNVPRDYAPDLIADLSSAREGDGCPTCVSPVIASRDQGSVRGQLLALDGVW